MPVTLTPKQSSKQTKLLVFSWHFSLFSWSILKFIQNNCETDKFPTEISHMNFPSFKVKSIFQIIYYHVAGTKHKHMSWMHTQYMRNVRTWNWLMLSISNICALVITPLNLSDPILENIMFFRVCQLQFLY